MLGAEIEAVNKDMRNLSFYERLKQKKIIKETFTETKVITFSFAYCSSLSASKIL